MTLYVFFPVGVFYYFNAPGYFDQQVERKRIEIFPKGNKPPLTFEDNERLRKEIKQEEIAAGKTNTAS